MMSGSPVRRLAACLLALLLVAPAGTRAEETLGAASLPQLIGAAQVALAEKDLAGITRLLVTSDRTIVATFAFVAALQSTPRAAQLLMQPAASTEDLVRLAREDPDVADLEVILERRGMGHVFGSTPEPWDELLQSGADEALVLQRLQASVGQDPVGLVGDLHRYLERFRAEDGSSPLDGLLQALPRGELRDLEVETGPDGPTEGSAQTDDSTVYFVRERGRWLMRIWDVRIEAAAPK